MLLSQVSRCIVPAVAAVVVASAQAFADWTRPGDEGEVRHHGAFEMVNDPHDHEAFTAGGELVKTFAFRPRSITPLVYTDVYAQRVNELVVESLGRIHPEDLSFEGVLAEAWQHDHDGRWFRVKIRENARFSDGEPVTAEDVAYTFGLMMDPSIEAVRFRAQYSIIDRVEVIDRHVVEFHFDEPLFDNKERALLMPVLPRHFYEQFTADKINASTGLLVGTGPFRLENADPDQQWAPGGEDIVLVQNENYWGPRPALDRLRFSINTDELARLQAFNDGKTHMIQPTDWQYATYSARGDWREENRALKWYNIRGGYSFIAWNCGEAPFDDPRVRRAMTHLIDRQRLINETLNGVGRVATGPFNSITEQANSDIEPLAYNRDRARNLLAEAGWRPDGDGVLRNEDGERFEFDFIFATGSESARQVARHLRDQCHLVGIRCRINAMDWPRYAEVLQSRQFNAITLGWSPNTPEQNPYGIWHSASIGDGDNFAQWTNARADELIEQGMRETDRAKRIATWHELHQVIHEEQPYTFLAERPWLRFISNRVGNVHQYKTGIEFRELFLRDEQGR